MASTTELGPVLIANRGEIAVRVARTAHALGLRTVGLFTAADAGARHVDAVDTAVRIESYLDVDAVLAAAARAGARSVHPGYGFLSENARFARAVVDAGLVWIGPPPDAITLMGDKGAAKQAADAAGVPIVPAGDDGIYPVVVKALAGGGGKGMRVVRSAGELEEATASAKREALAAFGDDRVMIERWIDRPRHIEVQVFADAHGHVMHFGERECSLQRRHQKVIEEAPSPVVGTELRERMGAAAVALAAACGYQGAGTVEFITPADASEFFFLEMNTRLQVEHPVTELAYGVDLVELQLRAAAGEALAEILPERLRGGPVSPIGHAIEARLYAEDPAGGFLPSTGEVRLYREPAGTGPTGPFRVDSGIRSGAVVGTSFDPMLAKVVAHGGDRAEAIARLDRALADLVVLGVTTNAAFSRALLARDDVRAGEQDTGLIERILATDEAVAALAAPKDLVLAAALVAAGTSHPEGLWRMAYDQGTIRVENGTVALDDGTPVAAEIRALGEPGDYAVELDGIARTYAALIDGEDVWIGRDAFSLHLKRRRIDRSGTAAPEGSLEAPMPGTVLQVRVENGQVVAEGDVLIVLESMKMELSITAPRAGTVEGLTLAAGDRVELGQALVAVQSAGADCIGDSPGGESPETPSPTTEETA